MFNGQHARRGQSRAGLKPSGEDVRVQLVVELAVEGNRRRGIERHCSQERSTDTLHRSPVVAQTTKFKLVYSSDANEVLVLIPEGQ